MTRLHLRVPFGWQRHGPPSALLRAWRVHPGCRYQQLVCISSEPG